MERGLVWEEREVKSHNLASGPLSHPGGVPLSKSLARGGSSPVKWKTGMCWSLAHRK